MVEDLYTAIADTARLLDVPCSRDKVLPLLKAYEDGIPHAVIAFRVATGARAGEFNCHFMMLPQDTYKLALSHGLTTELDHPVSSLLADLAQVCPIDSYGVDFAIGGGFKKTWAIFPGDRLQSLSTLATVPSMPQALADNMDFFTRHGLEHNVSLVGMDYGNRTTNLYFGRLPQHFLEPQTIVPALRSLGLPAPSPELLALAPSAFGVYVTLRWDTPKIERFCFSIMTPDPRSLPVRLDPVIEHFLAKVPYDAAGRKLFYAALSAAEGEFHKVQTYYQWRDRTLNIMQLSR